MVNDHGVVVFGAGPAGLSAAHHLGGDCPVYEKAEEIGGHCRTRNVNGFLFDEGIHVFFGTNDVSRQFVREPLAEELVHHRAEIWNNYGGRRCGRYPVQANLNALGPELATRCLVDFVEALGQPEPEIRSYADWCRASFGHTMAEAFMLRYARKIWTVDAAELTTEWLGSTVGTRVSRPSLDQVVRGAIDPEPQTLNYLTEFVYPKRGGFAGILSPIARSVQGIRKKAGVVRIDSARRVVKLADGSERPYRAAISTIPLPSLVSLVSDAPGAVREASSRLLWTSVRCVNIGLARADLGPGHWVYFYDPEIPFFRVSFPHKFSPGNAPAGWGSISCEIAYSPRRPLGQDLLEDRVLQALRTVGILREDDAPLVVDQVDIPYAYVVFDFERVRALEVIHQWMASVDLIPCGRFGEWGYHWSFDAIDSGRRAAERVRAAESRA